MRKYFKSISVISLVITIITLAILFLIETTTEISTIQSTELTKYSAEPLLDGSVNAVPGVTQRAMGEDRINRELLDGGFVDFIKPNATYQFSETDIDHDGKTFTMVFDMTDKFYNSGTLTLEDLAIRIDGEEPDWTKVDRALQEEDRTNVINEETEVIGKRYTLTLSNLEQLQVKEGDNYLDYSGVVTVAIPANKIIDTTGNGNNATTLTSGITLPGGAGTEEVVDVVDPLVEKISSSVDTANKTAEMTFKVTDKYFANSTLTNENIQIVVNGSVNTTITKQLTSTVLNEQRVVNGESSTVQYGVQYTLTLTGIDTTVNQIKVRVPEGLVTDASGNGNTETDLILFNTLRNASTDISEGNLANSIFLGNTNIQRQNVENVTFMDYIPETVYDRFTNTYIDETAWDVSAMGDNSIIAWYEPSANGTVKVYIGSNDEMFGNVDSSYLFSYIGSSNNCTATETITNIQLLNTGNVSNMSYMFNNTGYTAMTSLDLGDNFDTSNVTNMSQMFSSAGYTAMTSLDLGDNFDTSNVTDMSGMFSSAGYTAMTSLNLGEKFKTSRVINMNSMFSMVGFTSLTNLDLGNEFDTSNVTNMSEMFSGAGFTAMTHLNLGDKFDTSNVTNMSSMFSATGSTAMTNLNLGDKFDTGKVTNMYRMFSETGRTLMTTLDLGDKFDTSNVTNMERMFLFTGQQAMTSLDLGPAFINIAESNENMTFANTGKSGEIVIQVPEAIYQDSTHFKLNTDSSQTMGWTDTLGNEIINYGTINPKYRTEWIKEEAEIDETEADNPKINITLRGTTNTEVNATEYISNVTSTLTSNDIKVFIDDTEITDVVTKTVGTATQTPNTRTGAQDVLQVLTLSNFEEATRRTGKDYKEWSGNIRVEVAQGTLSDTTGPADETGKTITYGNKNMEVVSTETQTGATTGAGAVTEIGARIDNIIQDVTKVDQNTTNAMFADFVKPEFTYRSQNTEISQDEEKVTIVFDVVDKFFESTTLSNLDASQIVVHIDDYDVTELNANITKTLTKVEDLTATVEGVDNTKIGERYQLVITGLDQEDEDGNGDGYTYSGYMTLSFAQGTVTDKSGNISSAKSITIGKDDPGGQDGDEEVVDVVDPVWSVSEVDADSEIVKIRVKDKFLNKDESIFNITEDSITIIVNGTPSTAIATILAGPTEIIPNEEYEYTITLENVTPDDGGYTEFTPVEPIVGGTAKYKNDNGGHISLEIDEGVVTDQYGNASNRQILDVGDIDKTTLEVYDVQKTQDEAQGKETIIFNVTDKNYDPTDPVTVDELTVWMNGVQVDDQVAKNILSTVEIKANINGEIKVLGHQYTVEISELVETDEEFVGSGRDYRELSGTLELRIDPNASRDIRGNTINEETTTITDFVDFIKPEVRYTYNTSDIDYDGKTFTMEFNIVDKYLNEESLDIEDLTILIDGEEPNWDDTGVHGVVRTLTEQDITDTINGESKTVGKHYTLKLSHLEQLEKLAGKETMDYSGVITVAIPSNVVIDTTGHGNVATTITSGLNILAGDPGEATVVDVVDPIWEKVDSAVDVDNKTITTTVKATDKYFANSNLTADNIKVLVNGIEVSKDNISINVGAKTVASTEDGTDVIGDQYTITFSGDGLDFNTNQIKIQIAEGTAVDQSGNGNKVTDIILYNTLKATHTETEQTSAFLGNTNIQRQNVDNVTFVDNIPSAVYDFSAKTYVDNTAWDASAQGDNSIIGWYETNTNGTVKVYIGSNNEIFGNVNSSYLFANVGYSSNCTTVETITNIGLLNTSNVTNMSNMFSWTGRSVMTSLDLGEKFDTSNVTDMSGMFSATGLTSMTTLNLGDNFNTSKVTTMSSMFSSTGSRAMTSLDLGNKFDTSNVKTMESMFEGTGSNAMTSLDLGENFDTSNVVNTRYMFNNTGYTTMTSLDLGDKFDTSHVNNMYGMFSGTGYTAMVSLDLGDKFDTSNASDMGNMFYETGYTAMTSLDLGDKFDTSHVTNMNNMFYGTGNTSMTSLDLGPAFTNIAGAWTNMFLNTGKSGEIVIQAPEAIYQNSTNFKLNTDSSTTIEFTNGTINPKYRTEWIKEEAEIDETEADNPKINITLRGTTNTEVDATEYISDVTSTLTSNHIKVFIDDTEITDIITKSLGTATQTPNTRTGAQDVLQVLTLSNFEEATRRTGIPYKEWSGNIRVEVAQGSLSDTTGPADENGNRTNYGNKNMEVASTETQTGAETGAGAVTEIGARIDNIIQDTTKVDKNTDNTMFADFINPEFTYRSQDTEIIHGDEEKVTIVFDVVDKFFESTTLSNLDASQITVQIDDYDVTELNNAITKELTKVEDITGTVEGVENTKIGERYQLVITGLDQEDADGNGDGYTYSGYMTLSFAQGTVTDKSGNTSHAKSITIGKDDPGGADGDEDVVDVVDPIWTLGAVDRDNGTIKLRVKDKFLNKEESIFGLTIDDITVIVNGQPSTEIGKVLSEPVEIIPNEEYEYTLTLTNIIPEEGGYTTFTPIEHIIGGTAQYRNENGGYISIEIAEGAITDQYENTSNKQTFEVGYVDGTGPEVYDVQKVQDATTGKNTIIFNVTDKNYDPTDPVTLDELSIWMDGVPIDDQITKRLVSRLDIKANMNGEVQVLGHQYTLEISGIVETDEEFIGSGRDYRELSGNLEVRVDPNASRDTRGNIINEEKSTVTDFVDYIKPEVRYTYNNSDIDYDGKTFTMEFNIVDKYLDQATLTLDDLNILIDGEEPNWDDTGIHGVVKELIEQDITGTVNGTNKVVGKHYTLKLSHLEQLEKLAGKETMDYSGVITVAIPSNVVVDTTGNGNNPTTITSGINILAGEDGEAVTVDVVDPIWEKVSSTVDVDNKTATITVKGTDKYFANSNLTQDKIKVFINGTEVSTANISINVGGKTTAYASNGTDVIGDQYTITLSGEGLDFSTNQIKIQIGENTAVDQSGNGNKATDIVVFNTLRKTDTEVNPTYAFLGNSNIERQNIDNVTFVGNIPSTVYDFSAKTYVDSTAWDVSAQGDNSIIGWYETNSNGSVKVYIASNDEIFANVDSSYLFAHIGYGANCTATETITNISLLNTSHVTNMSRMFWATGYNAMISLDLGENFDTSHVTDMRNMFSNVGQNAMTSLDLGDHFDTSNVTDMYGMFANAGQNAMISLDLGDNFDTSKVTTMNGMFSYTGSEAMTSLDLGDKFNTSLVTDMSGMFYYTGYNAMTTLDLGASFDTSNVANMSNMFANAGQNVMTALDLGEKFYTTKVTDMSGMFNGTGLNSMTTLDLGPAFTKIVETNTDMFRNTGKSGEIVIQAPEAIYNDRTHLKLNTDSETMIGWTDADGNIITTYGTINPKYKPEWTKISSTINEENQEISIVIQGQVDQSVYTSNANGQFLEGELTEEQANLINVYMDGELAEGITKSISGVTEIIDDVTGTKSVQYTITLSNFEEALRQSGKNFKEWSGNIALQLAKGTLMDDYGNKNMEAMDTEHTQTADGEEFEWINIELKDADTDRNTNGTMFADYIKPEFTYETYDTTIDYDQKNVSIIFDVTDKYFESTTMTQDMITITVDETQLPEDATITKTLSKVTQESDVVDGNITYKANGDIYYTVDGVEKKVGERYQLLVEGLETENGEGYSGPMSLSFPANIVTDTSGNQNDAKTITLGIDEPQNPEHPDHDEPIIVDVVNPVWRYLTSSIDRENETVTVMILGTDKYYRENTLTEDDIKVYLTDSETPNEEVTTISKTLTEVDKTSTEYADILAQAQEKGIGDIGVAYKLVLGDYGELSGATKVVLSAGTITDISGNTNIETEIPVGNPDWVEEGDDPANPIYTAFRNNIVDFINPTIRYTYSDVEDSSNPDIDYEAKTLTVKFTVTDKYIRENTIMNPDGTMNTENIRIKVAGTDLTDQLHTTVTSAEIPNGTEYTFVVSNFELVYNENDKYQDYSGAVDFVFAEGKVDDTSGNKNTATTITLDYDDGDDPDNPVIVDVIDPLVERTEDNLSIVNANNGITRDLDTETGTVSVRIRATDKYLGQTTLQDAENTANMKVKVVKPTGETVYPDTIVKQVTQVSKTTTAVVYQITLSNFEDNQGITSIIIPEGVITDQYGNTNQETEILVGNATWTEVGDVNDEYTAFRESIVDFTRPTWEYADSRITRDRDGETGTVTVKILGRDDYYLKDTLTSDNINVYVDNSENPETPVTTITKTLTKITDEAELDGADVGYELTLGNFGTYDGAVKIEIAENTIRDRSGIGNKVTQIPVGNPNWVETDVGDNADNPKYTAFRNNIVDFIKPKITYQYAEGTNPVIDQENKQVTIHFDAVDTNFLESDILTVDDIEQILVDGMDVTNTLTKELTSSDIPEGEGNGVRYTLTLSNFELPENLENEIFRRHSGKIELVIAENKVRDTSGNANIETKIIVDNDNGDDENNYIRVDFINPKLYLKEKFISYAERYATVTISGTDRFYDFNTTITPEDISIYELNRDGEYIQRTDLPITITPVRTEYGYDFVVRFDEFEEEFKQLKISIPAGKISDTEGHTNEATDIYVDLDNKKPVWKYEATDTSEFESNGKISFTVKGKDTFLVPEESNLEAGDIRIIKDGVDITNADNITVQPVSEDADEISKTYQIDVTGLTEIGTYSLVIAKDTLVDEFDNYSNATTISFSKSAISDNTENYTNVTYHVTPDFEQMHHAYVHELMNVTTSGTNEGSSVYRASSIGELYGNGDNNLFAEPFTYENGVQTAYSFAGWATANEEGFSEENATVYDLYTDIPSTVTNLRAVWQEATVIFVSSGGNNANDGLSPTTPVQDLTTAYSKLNASGNASNNIIVIMDAIEWNSSERLVGNATITSLYAGIDYRTSGAELKVSSNMDVQGNITFDNIELYADSTTVSDGSDYLAKGDYTNILVTNYGDVTLGRGISTPEGKYTFGGVVGGNYKEEETTGTIGNHRMIVEAGQYNDIIIGSSLNKQSPTRKYVSHEVIIGTMKESVIARNDKLVITGYLAMGELEDRCYPYNSEGAQDTENAYSRTYAETEILSGTFTGENKFHKSSEDAVMYLRSINGYNDGKSQLDMYGGNVTGNIYGGARMATSKDERDEDEANANFLNFYGGQVSGKIFGHGGNDTSTGNAEISLQGATQITGNIYGGSNTTTAGQGRITGDTDISVVGTITVNGSIFGGSNGVVEGTNINLNTGLITGSTHIELNNGAIITGDVYGGGNNAGVSSNGLDYGSYIELYNGQVMGTIYGGAYQNQVRTEIQIAIMGGIVNDIYGGNILTTQAQLNADTENQDVVIMIGNPDSDDNGPTINGTIYGSGIYDRVGNVYVRLNKCVTAPTIYGGSDGAGMTNEVNIWLMGMTANTIYGGSKTDGTVTTSNIYLAEGTVTDVYGGGFGGTTTTSNIMLDELENVLGNTVGGTANVTNIYGGSNTNGTVGTSNVNLSLGNVTNVFGGGNGTGVGTANVNLDGITIDTIFGGSKNAGITTNTNVQLNSGTATNVFGGGYDTGVTNANVTQNGANVTNIFGGNQGGTGDGGETTNATINIEGTTAQNIYGGNQNKGITRNTTINITGNATIHGELYGGGLGTEIGRNDAVGSTTINITGGTIQNDINGGSKGSIVYGTTNINIGKDAVTNDTLTAGNIVINGNIYGSGDSENEGYNTVSVHGETHIRMDNSGESPITFDGSIFGAGKGATYSPTTSDGTDNSSVEIKDFGTSAQSYTMTSIERTGKVIIDNSYLELIGAQDENNYYQKTSYTLNRITNGLTLQNNTTLYTQRGFNMVGGFESLLTNADGTTTKETAVIADGAVTRNVDNRIYTLEGVNLIFAKAEGDLSNRNSEDIWGDVNGMAFFGMYRMNRSTGNKEYDIYAPNYAGTATNNMFKAGTYIEGRHKPNHDTTVDGFYTNVVSEGSTTAVPQVIEVTDYGTYYDWIIGADIVNYNTQLIASIFGTESTAELTLDFNSFVENATYSGTTFSVDKVSTNALNTDVNLINKLSVPIYSENANNTFGLTMGTSNSGWQTSGETNIYTDADGSFDGDTVFKTDNSNTAGTLQFKIFSSVNISETKDLGNVNIVLTAKAKTGEDASMGNTFKVVIAVNLQTEQTPNIENYIPTFTNSSKTKLNYTTDSQVDITYVLYKEVQGQQEDFYANGDYRVLSTTMPLPQGTGITIRDYGQGNTVNKVYYYQVASDTDYDATDNSSGTTRYLYNLSDFVEMGGTATTDKYANDNSLYYHNIEDNFGYALEKYDVSIDFKDSNISTDQLAQETYLELRNQSGAIKYDNGETQIVYDLYNKNAIMSENVTTNDGRTSYTVFNNLTIPFTLDASLLEQTTDDGTTIKDTKYYDKYTGLAIEIVDEHGERIKAPAVQNLRLTDVTTSTVYGVGADGVIRVPLSEGLSTIQNQYALSLSQNSVPAGQYIAKIYFFASDDGSYYGGETKQEQEIYITFINKLLGLAGLESVDGSRIINKNTGMNLVQGDGLDLTVKVGSPTDDTNIRVELYKRNPTYTTEEDGTTTYNPIEYTQVDLKDYLENLDGTEWKTPEDYAGQDLVTTEGCKEYVIMEKKQHPEQTEGENIETIDFKKAIKEGIDTGEYKLVFKAYYNNTLIQTIRKSFIVVP